MASKISAAETVRDLGDGLILRRSTPADARALVAFNKEIHDPPHIPGFNERIAAWVRDLMEGKVPGFSSTDFTIVEDTATRKIVSCANLISQTWSYGGVEFPVGRPELVGTLSEYRRKGLVRAQFDLIHQWSAARGELALVITGIPWFYRQFGYEMALELSAEREIPASHIPELKKGEKEAFSFRPAKRHDIPFLSRTYAGGISRYAVSCPRTKSLWEYELSGRRRKNFQQLVFFIIEDRAASRPVGFLAHFPTLWGNALASSLFEIKPGISWLPPTYAALRFLKKTGRHLAQKSGGSCDTIALTLSTDHPAYRVLPDLIGKAAKPYAYYMRVPDLPRFIRHIRPALERRLSASTLCGHTGDLNISIYRENLRLVFKKGRLNSVKSGPLPRTDAAFPHLSFLQLLFGLRSLADLEAAYPDCGVNTNEARVLLNILFPKSPSLVWALA